MSRSIFIDTSAIYALADRNDANYERARTVLEEVLDRGDTLVTHSYVMVESVALIQRRLGSAVAINFLESARTAFEIVWIDSSLHEAAVELLRLHPRRRISFVDRVSFVVMKDRGLDAAFAFDDDFRREGFEVV